MGKSEVEKSSRQIQGDSWRVWPPSGVMGDGQGLDWREVGSSASWGGYSVLRVWVARRGQGKNEEVRMNHWVSEEKFGEIKLEGHVRANCRVFIDRIRNLDHNKKVIGSPLGL